MYCSSLLYVKLSAEKRSAHWTWHPKYDDEAYAPPAEVAGAAVCFLVPRTIPVTAAAVRRRMRARVNERPFLHMRGFGLSLAFWGDFDGCSNYRIVLPRKAAYMSRKAARLRLSPKSFWWTRVLSRQARKLSSVTFWVSRWIKHSSVSFISKYVRRYIRNVRRTNSVYKCPPLVSSYLINSQGEQALLFYY